MRHLIFLALFIMANNVSAQSNITGTEIPSGKIAWFIDSLKAKIVSDTIKFSRKDLIHSNLGTRNTKPYSALFIVNMKYEYLLDIVNGREAKEFMNEFLDVNKIETIHVFNASGSDITFGTKGRLGVIMIGIKKGIKSRYEVAGLKIKNKKEQQNNFAQRKNGELKIVY
jgi:hypothetical protein